MKKQELMTLLQSVSMNDLKRAVAMKGKLEKLEAKKKALEKTLASVTKEIVKLESVFRARAGAGPTGSAKKTTKRRRKRVSHPPLATLIAEILGERKVPLAVNEICRILLDEKGYKSRAKDFKGQVRVMLYRNQKGAFKKVGPGTFTLAGGKPGAAAASAGKGSKSAKAATKKKSTTKKKGGAKKKVSTKKKATTKKVSTKKKAATKKKVPTKKKAATKKKTAGAAKKE